MQSKIFLHGGKSSKPSSKNKEFFEAVLNSVRRSDLKILCVYFARPKLRWEESFEIDKELFLKNRIGKSIELIIAKPDTFQDQINNVDIVYLSGGKKGILKEVLMDIDDLENLFKDKVVVGVSAGANILSTYYYSTVASKVREGTGLLPIKLFTHYRKEKEEELDILKSYGSDLLVYTVAEEEFVVL